jgi:hypothetical protein
VNKIWTNVLLCGYYAVLIAGTLLMLPVILVYSLWFDDDRGTP